jgi:hypothetical protein
LKIIFQHQFPGNIHRISYFGTQNEPKIWVDISMQTEKKWFILNLQDKLLQEIKIPFDKSIVYTWLDANENSGFFSLLEKGKNPKSIGFAEVNLIDGAIRSISEKFNFSVKEKKMASQLFSIQIPSHYHTEKSYFKDFQQFFEIKFNQKIDKGIDYLEGDNKLIFSYYLYENTWLNKLKVCNLDFTSIWDDTIETTELIGHTTFQVFENLIIYTKNKNELIILGNE